MRADPDVLGVVNTAVIHREYPSSGVYTNDRNIAYRSKCSSMIYDKTNVYMQWPWKPIRRQRWSH